MISIVVFFLYYTVCVKSEKNICNIELCDIGMWVDDDNFGTLCKILHVNKNLVFLKSKISFQFDFLKNKWVHLILHWPCLFIFFQSSSSFESAILGEAHGLITDMLADQSLPLNIVSGLRTLSNLLKPPESHSSFHKTRVSPLVSLTESTSYGSDTEENPYTGERPSTKVRLSIIENVSYINLYQYLSI